MFSSRVILFLLPVVSAWHCRLHGEKPWEDFCNGNETRSNGVSGCRPYSPLDHDTSVDAWTHAREQLQAEIFGPSGAPTRSTPDVGPTPVKDGIVFGNCICLLRGNCKLNECTAPINLTKFEWSTTAAVNSTHNLTLTSTVFHSLNSSGLAPDNQEGFSGVGPFKKGEPIWPEVPMWPQRMSDTLVIWHDGHTVTDGCHYDLDGTVDWLNQVGFDVMHIQMPYHGCNAADPLHPKSHTAIFEPLAKEGVFFMRFFLDPVVLTINYAQSLGYKNIVMAGLSGGGWTTTVASAIDTRIGMSFPVAGSMPCDFAHTSWDFEQFCDDKWAWVANYTSLYVMAALEKGRNQVQIIHEWDNCCFHACGRHTRIAEYNSWVRSMTNGQFVTSATDGNVHEVNPRDKVIIAMMTEKWLNSPGGVLEDTDVENMPFSVTPLRPPTKEEL